MDEEYIVEEQVCFKDKKGRYVSSEYVDFSSYIKEGEMDDDIKKVESKEGEIVIIKKSGKKNG